MASVARVLVVEDDPDIAESVQIILQMRGYDVATAANGEEALAVFEAHKPSVILLDMLMPVMNGWQFATELAKRHPTHPPIIVMTAAEHARARALEVGSAGVVKKPFEARTLLDTLADVLGHKPRQTKTASSG